MIATTESAVVQTSAHAIPGIKVLNVMNSIVQLLIIVQMDTEVAMVQMNVLVMEGILALLVMLVQYLIAQHNLVAIAMEFVLQITHVFAMPDILEHHALL